MAAPRHGLRAHGGSRLLLTQLYQRIEILHKFRRLHVIRVATEARVTPCGIDRITPRMPQAAKPRHVTIMQPLAMQHAG